MSSNNHVEHSLTACGLATVRHPSCRLQQKQEWGQSYAVHLLNASILLPLRRGRCEISSVVAFAASAAVYTTGMTFMRMPIFTSGLRWLPAAGEALSSARYRRRRCSSSSR